MQLSPRPTWAPACARAPDPGAGTLPWETSALQRATSRECATVAGAHGAGVAAGRQAGPPGAPAGAAGRPSLDTPQTSCIHERKRALTLAGDPTEEQQFRFAVARYLGPRWKARARDLARCGRHGVYLVCQGCDAPAVVPYRCTCRTCPHAQRAGAAVMADRLLARIRVHDVLMEAEPWDGAGRKQRRTWRMLTLTCPVVAVGDRAWSEAVLRATVRTVRSAFARFWRLTAWGGQVGEHGRRRARRDTSALTSLEVGGQHAMVHLHALVYGEFIEQAELERLWSRALGRAAIVHVQRVKGDVADAVREVVKYLAKGVGAERLPPQRAANVELALRNVHRVSIVGALRRVKVTDQDGAADDVRAEDVHDRRRAACECCGLIGEWHYGGLCGPDVAMQNGGFGMVRAPPELPAGLLS